MFIVGLLFQCEDCGKENNISDIKGTCGNCDNNKMKNFKVIITSGMYTLSKAKEILESALNKEKILIIDPKSNINMIFIQK
ncbi:hypothetical protein SIL19_25875 [Bacillus cereus group sp. BfR-BA-00431]|uniref:hypothetical protein n=1 Tax=Bacillus cereus group sp. BfR-BA-00431 TaxID=3094868 RepID=UPI0029C4E768|nr:hypothetical protein [Bacillus cereus group sp. BfR-BA-00431]MDX5947328.1 hypothetical protein [Bacillus cereus group sp. BfR-BA-00431]